MRQTLQPPSGGCVLKQTMKGLKGDGGKAAAFGRLCVETFIVYLSIDTQNAAAFGRLCVETCVSRLKN